MPVPEVDFSKCKGHFDCVDVCPMDVFEKGDGKVIVKNPDACIGCKACEVNCPEGAIKVKD